MPHDLPAWGTVYDYFRTWRIAGIWDKALQALHRQMRQKQGRDEEPSAAVIDSQSIKTSAVRGPEKGFDMGKQIWGRKRHALVDTQGNLIDVHADLQANCGVAYTVQGPGMAYDTARDSIIIWPNAGNTVYEYKPYAHTCTAITYPNGPPAAFDDSTYGRWQYLPSLDLHVVCPTGKANCWALKLQ